MDDTNKTTNDNQEDVILNDSEGSSTDVGSEDSNELRDSSPLAQNDNTIDDTASEEAVASPADDPQETEPTEAEQADEETTPADDVTTEAEDVVEGPVSDEDWSDETDQPAQEEVATDPEAIVEPGSEEDQQDKDVNEAPADDIIHSDDPNVKWYVVHTYSGHENKVATALKQRVESEHLEHKILDVLVPTQEKIEIRGGKKTPVKEKIFPGYILVKMDLDDNSWLAVRTTQGVTSFVGIGNKPTPIPEQEVRTIVKYMSEGAAPTFKDVFLVNDTVKIIDGPFSEFIGKVDGVDKEKGKVRVLVSIFGRETPVELDFLQIQKL